MSAVKKQHAVLKECGIGAFPFLQENPGRIDVLDKVINYIEKMQKESRERSSTQQQFGQLQEAISKNSENPVKDEAQVRDDEDGQASTNDTSFLKTPVLLYDYSVLHPGSGRTFSTSISPTKRSILQLGRMHGILIVMKVSVD